MGMRLLHVMGFSINLSMYLCMGLCIGFMGLSTVLNMAHL